MANSVQGLVLRIPNGAPLTAIQGDNNLNILASFCNSLAAIISASLNPNGTLIAGAINNINQFASAAIPSIIDGLNAGSSLPTSVFNSGTNVYAVTNTSIHAPLTKGCRAQFIADAPNTTSSFVNFNGTTNVPILNGYNQQIIPNEIVTGMVVQLVFDGTNFQIFTQAGKFTASGISVSNASGVIAAVPHGFTVVPSFWQWSLVNITTENNYNPGDTVKVESIVNSTNSVPVYTSVADATNVYLLYSTGGASNQQIANKTTGTRANLGIANWKAKVVAFA